MNAGVLSKAEFWLLSIPSLVVSIGAVARYGTWRVIWVVPVGMVLATLLKLGRGLVTEELAAPRTNACLEGKWPKAYALVMLIALYDWFAVVAFADLVYLAVVWRYHAAMPLAFVYVAVYATSFAMPSFTRMLQNRTDGGYGAIMVEVERAMLLLAIVAAAVVPLTPVWFAAATLAFGVVAVGWIGTLWYRSEKKRYVSYLEAEMRGQAFVQSGAKHLFPRPGILYEPPEKPDSILAKRLAHGDWDLVRDALTIRWISPVAFLSLGLLLGGAAVLIDTGHGLCLFSFAAAMVLWFFFSAFTAGEKNTTWLMTAANAAPYSLAYFALGSLAVWIGGEGWTQRLAVAAFLVGSFEFPTRYVVRAKTEKRPDWLRPIFTLLAVALALWSRSYGQGAWVCGVTATVAAYPLVLLRRFWPVKPLPALDGGHTAAPGAVSGDPAKKNRRDRKRERQMGAFRRSQGRGAAE